MAALFITFEGLDGSGKSTQIERAREWLEERGEEPVVTREPGGSALGEALREILLAHEGPPVDGTAEALLMFAARRRHLIEVVEPALAEGRHVLCDRFTDSTLAYQGGGRGVPRESLLRLDQLATGGRRPDATLLLDVAPEVARERSARGDAGGGDRLDGEPLEFYHRVRECYLELAAEEPERIRVIDSSGPPDATTTSVRVALVEIFGSIS